MSGELHVHDRGLAYDLATMARLSACAVVPTGLDRRQLLKVFAGAGLVAVVGCGSDGRTASAPSASASSAAPTPSIGSTGSAADCDQPIPEETAGPYPGDGSNGPNVLTESGIVRSDIRPSFGSSSGVADGVPLTINLTVLDTSDSCAALAGAAVYLWHCDRAGGYSLYSQGVTGENYLRGVQEADRNGQLTFQSIFPAAYSGRWPHIHFEVYPSLAKATNAANKIRTSQLAFPVDVCSAVYATSGYEQSVQNLSATSLDRDMVFGDGYEQQLAGIGGSVKNGLTADLAVPV